MTTENEHPAVAVVDTAALMNLGNINARIAPLSISADGLAQHLRAAVEGVPA